jgi:DNA-binding CsgD family transcriptional regulator
MLAWASEELLEALYDPALRYGEWRPALCSLRHLLDSAEIAFSVVEGKEARSRLWETTGYILTAPEREKYERYYGRLDPKMAILAHRGRGFLFNDAEHFQEGFVARDSFYQEYTLPQGLRHTLDLFAGSYDGRNVYLAAMRSSSQGPYDSAACAQLRRASGHFVRVLKAREDLARAEAAAAYAGAALDSLDYGIAVVDAEARVLFANAFARNAFAAGRPFDVPRARLTARHAPEAFAERIRLAVAGRPSSFRPRDSDDWLVSALPLPPASPAAPSAQTSALVVFRRASARRVPAPDAARALYGLTRAEAEIAVAIASGKSLRGLAAERGVKLSTVRWQLNEVLHKLGVGRQADIVRVLAAIRL